MRIKDVVTLKEVVNDLNDGKAFYDQRETGVGDYFWYSLIADIESLRIYTKARAVDMLGRQQIADASTAISEFFNNAHNQENHVPHKP